MCACVANKFSVRLRVSVWLFKLRARYVCNFSLNNAHVEGKTKTIAMCSCLHCYSKGGHDSSVAADYL